MCSMQRGTDAVIVATDDLELHGRSREARAQACAADDQPRQRLAHRLVALDGRHPRRALRPGAALRPRAAGLARARPLHPQQGARLRGALRGARRARLLPGRERLDTYYQDGSPLAGHATHKGVPGVEVSTGSLGHGLSLGAGMALAPQARRQAAPRLCVCSATASATRARSGRRRCSRRTTGSTTSSAIVDYNKIQSLGRVKDVLDLEPLADKWRAFGWACARSTATTSRRSTHAFAAVPLRARPAELHRRPHGQGQGRHLHGGQAPVALPVAARRGARRRRSGRSSRRRPA